MVPSVASGKPSTFSMMSPALRPASPAGLPMTKLPAGRVILSIASASMVWFGIITFLAFRAGDNWDLLQSYLVRSGKLAGAIAVAIVALVIGIWLWKRRHRKDE